MREMVALPDRLAGLATMPMAELKTEWSRVIGTPAPEALGRDLLMLAIAYELQARELGGLPASTERSLRQARKTAAAPTSAQFPALRPGTRLARSWRGRTHHVAVLDDGFEYREQRFASLSAIAREITGAAWSGPRFFGLLSAKNAQR